MVFATLSWSLYKGKAGGKTSWGRVLAAPRLGSHHHRDTCGLCRMQNDLAKLPGAQPRAKTAAPREPQGCYQALYVMVVESSKRHSWGIALLIIFN